MKTFLLDQIKDPSDLHQFSQQQLTDLAADCRQRIIEFTSQKGGHLASSLGTVELTIALAYVFNFSQDKVIWDVGHQAYTYKILTGRNQKLYTMGDIDGVSKFLSRNESEFDYFGAGHASTSISAALGFAVEASLSQRNTYNIAVIGDGGLTGGMAFEALNHAGQLDENLIVILNDNQMSITPITGGLAKTFNNFTASLSLNRLRSEVMRCTRKKRFPVKLKKLLHRFNDSLLAFFSQGVWFEKLNFKYFGQIDGHNLANLISILTTIKKLKGPILLHINTVKGKGFSPAEQDSLSYHGVGQFNPSNGVLSSKKESSTYTRLVSQFLMKAMQEDGKIAVISAAMLANTELLSLQKQFPKRVFDVGIAEAHAVTFAASLAAAGMKPYVVIYSTFLQRAFDQILHDVALQKLPVTFLLDRAGFVGADGATHQGLFDLSYLRMIPNMVILSPQDQVELESMLTYTREQKNSPIAIRFPKSSFIPVLPCSATPISFGKALVLREGKQVTFFAEGRMVYKALQLAKLFAEKSVSIQVVNLRFIKPLDKETICEAVKQTNCWVSLEENQGQGGVGSALCEIVQRENIYKPYLHCAVEDKFVKQGTIAEQEKAADLDIESLYKKIEFFLQVM